MTLTRLAWRLAYSRDRRQRWRQISVILASALTALVALAGLCVIRGSIVADEHRLARSATFARGDDPLMSVAVTGMVRPNGVQIPLVTIQARPGHERDPRIVPPGLRSFPPPGHIVLTPTLMRQARDNSYLGWPIARVGSGEHGAIGDAGLVAANEEYAYLTPAAGRSIHRSDVVEPSVGYAPASEGREGLDFTSSPFMIDPMQSLYLVLWLGLLPALILLFGAARTGSGLRDQRVDTLFYLGIPRSILGRLTLLEGFLLAAPGAVVGISIWLVSSPHLQGLPFTHTALLPGSLVAEGWEALCAGAAVPVVTALASRGKGTGRGTSKGERREVPTWQLVPFVVGMAGMLAASLLPVMSRQRSSLLFIGVLLVTAGLPWALSWFAVRLGRLMSRVKKAAPWMGALRLRDCSRSLVRPAVAVGTLVLLSGASFALADRAQEVEPERGLANAYSLGWSDRRAGDVDDIRRRMPAGVALHPLTDTGVYIRPCRSEDDSSAEPGASGRDCAALRAVAVSAAKRASLALLTSSPPKPWGVLIVADRPLADAAILEWAPGLPRPNLSRFDGLGNSGGVLPYWILLGWATASVLLLLAVVRSVVERVLSAVSEDRRLLRIGLQPHEVRSVQRWSLLPPVLLAVPIGAVSAVAFALIGLGIGVTTRNTVGVAAVSLGIGVVTSLAMALGLTKAMKYATH